MGDRTSLPWMKICDVIAEISCAQTISELHGIAGSTISRIIPHDLFAISFGLINSKGHGFYEAFSEGRPDFPVMASSGGDERVIQDFNTYYWKLQPSPKRHESGAYAVDWRNEWRDTEFYVDFIAPLRIAYTLVPVAPGIQYALTIQRSKSSPPFTERDQRVLGIVSHDLDNLYSYLRKIDELSRSHLDRSEEASNFPGLTRRESQVVRLLSLRMSAGEIGAALVMSRRTVERHVADIYTKLEVNDRNSLLKRLFGGEVTRHGERE